MFQNPNAIAVVQKDHTTTHDLSVGIFSGRFRDFLSLEVYKEWQRIIYSIGFSRTWISSRSAETFPSSGAKEPQLAWDPRFPSLGFKGWLPRQLGGDCQL